MPIISNSLLAATFQSKISNKYLAKLEIEKK